MENTEEKKERSFTKEVILLILILSILVVSVVGISFSSFVGTQSGKNDNVVNSGTISMTYTEETNGIRIDNAVPTTDAAGKILSGSNEYFDFTVSSSLIGSSSITYEVAAMKDNSSTISDNEIRLYLEKEESGTYNEAMAPSNYVPRTSESTYGAPVGSMVLTTDTHNYSTSDNYRLRMWLGENAVLDFETRTYIVKINIYGKAN